MTGQRVVIILTVVLVEGADPDEAAEQLFDYVAHAPASDPLGMVDVVEDYVMEPVHG